MGWFVEGIIASARIHFLTLHMCLVELGCNAECIFLECDLRYHESSPITLTVKCWGGPAPSLFSRASGSVFALFFPSGCWLLVLFLSSVVFFGILSGVPAFATLSQLPCPVVFA